jgi:lipopolysaccharide biosynthesis glycosyltransferase
MLCSLLRHNRGPRIHILHSAGAGRELLKLKSFAMGYGSEVSLYQVSAEEVRGLRVDGWVSLAVYYRLLGPHILPGSITKILYLDSDIIVRRSLTELWNIDLGRYALAAVEDVGRPRRFNSGVMLINLNFWRQNNVPERAITFGRDHPEKNEDWDQSALNAILVDQWFELPPIWNGQVALGLGYEPPADSAIIHYAGPVKPWHYSSWKVPHPFIYEYHRYRRKTPWRRYGLQEGRAILPPRLARLASIVRVLLPSGARRWLKSRLMEKA